MGLDDLGQPEVVGAKPGRLREQLGRVAHGPDGVADFVRDARAQTSQ